jgi:hypothetical protein
LIANSAIPVKVKAKFNLKTKVTSTDVIISSTPVSVTQTIFGQMDPMP